MFLSNCILHQAPHVHKEWREDNLKVWVLQSNYKAVLPEKERTLRELHIHKASNFHKKNWFQHTWLRHWVRTIWFRVISKVPPKKAILRDTLSKRSKSLLFRKYDLYPLWNFLLKIFLRFIRFEPKNHWNEVHMLHFRWDLHKSRLISFKW